MSIRYSVREMIGLILLASLVSTTGCASNRSPAQEVFLPGASTIGVVIQPTNPDVALQIPGKGWLSNTGRGALNGCVIGGLGVICGYGFFLCVPALATVGAISGALYGAVAAEPASEWEPATSAFMGILSDLNIQQRVPTHVVEFAGSQTPYRVIRVEQESPSLKGEKAPYHALAGKGIDTVLELSELTVHLRPSSLDINPTRTLMMSIRTRAIRTSDGVVLAEHVVTADVSRPSWSLAGWAGQNAQVFREEITEATPLFAQQIVRELFSNTYATSAARSSASPPL